MHETLNICNAIAVRHSTIVFKKFHSTFSGSDFDFESSINHLCKKKLLISKAMLSFVLYTQKKVKIIWSKLFRVIITHHGRCSFFCLFEIDFAGT